MRMYSGKSDKVVVMGSSLVLSEKCKPRTDLAYDSEKEKLSSVLCGVERAVIKYGNKATDFRIEITWLHGERRRQRLKKAHPEVSVIGKFHSYSWVENGYLFSCCFL